MWQRVVAWLLPQPLDEERGRIAALLTFILTAFAIGVPVYAVVILVDDPTLALARAVTLLVFVAFLGAMVTLMRRGSIITVGRLMVLQMWLGLTGFVLIDAGINSPAFHWYTVIIIVAGLLMGLTGMLIVAGASIAASLIFVILTLSDIFQTRSYDPVYVWALNASAFVFTTAFLGLAVRGLKQSLSRARQAEATWRTIVEGSPDRIHLVPREAVNRPDSPDLAPVLADLPADQKARALKALERVFSVGDTQRFSYDTAERTFSLRANPITTDQGVNAAIVTLRDITESRLAEDQRLQLAVETEKMALLQSLIADVTHDMKTPLATIETTLYLLKHTNPDISAERVERIREQTRTLNTMVQNLITIMRLDSLPALDRQPVDLHALCQEILHQFLPIAQEKDIALHAEVAPQARQIEADPGELKRVIVNLTENAINYTPNGGRVQILAERRSETVHLEVLDTGIGMTPDELSQVFERFFRSAAARSTVSSGTGLGLAIAKRIVEMHGGTISVESQVGQGTRFAVCLPTHQGDCPPVAESA